MALDFPASPTVGQVYSLGAKSWTWNGNAWDIQSTFELAIDGGAAATVFTVGSFAVIDGGNA